MKPSAFRTITMLIGLSLVAIGFYIATNNLGITLIIIIITGLFNFILYLSGAGDEE